MQAEDVREGRCECGWWRHKRGAWVTGPHGRKKSGQCERCFWQLGEGGKAYRMVDCTVEDLRAQIAALEELQDGCTRMAQEWRDRRDCIEQLELLLPRKGAT